MSDVTLRIDQDTCVGYGECVAEDADAMELDEAGCARALLAVLDADRASRICAACPVGAISIAPARAA
jgi:ferredoxin